MDWNKQAQQMVDFWQDVQKNQQKLWESFMGTATRDQLDLWQRMTKESLNAQRTSLKMWVSNAKAWSGMPANMLDSLEQMMEQSIQSQQQLWDVWFDQAKAQMGMQAVMGNNPLVNAWQETMKRNYDAQTQWLSSLGQKQG